MCSFTWPNDDSVICGSSVAAHVAPFRRWVGKSASGDTSDAEDLAYDVTDKKMSADDAPKILAAAGAGRRDVNEVAYSVAEGKISADEAVKT